LDGTLLDTLDDIAECMNAALAAQGLFPYGRDRYRKFVGDGAENLARRALASQGAPEALLTSLLCRYKSLYALLSKSAGRTRPYGGILELLATLDGWGVRYAVCSNKPHEDVTAAAARYLSGGHFAAVLGQRPGRPLKPDPSIVREALAAMTLSPTEAVYLGDSGVDMRTARAAGLRAFGALWGFRDEAELVSNGAEACLTEPGRLLDFL
jgi:phosphoglycolate phosphatase